MTAKPHSGLTTDLVAEARRPPPARVAAWVRWGSCALATLLVVTVVGCSRARVGQQDAGGAVLPTAEVGDAPGVVSGIEELEPAVHDVEQQLAQRCLAGAGFEFATTTSVALAGKQRTVAATLPPPFGFDDVAAAEREGYGVDDADSDSGILPADQANQRFYESLVPAEKSRYDLLTGSNLEGAVSVDLGDGNVLSTSAKGCFADARRLLFDDLAEYIRLNHIAINVANEARDRTRTDPRYEQANVEWVGCMQAAGMPFASWIDAYEAAAASPAREQQIAVADARCAGSAGTVGLAEELFVEHERAVRADRAADLTAYRDLLERALHRAQDLPAG